MPPLGGSQHACALVRQAVSPVSVISDFDRIVEPPKLQVASPVNLLPTNFVSNLLHMPCIMPVDIRIISCCSEASRQSELLSGGRSLLRPFDVVISQSPALSLGKSCACAASDDKATSKNSVRNIRGLRKGRRGSIIRSSYRRIRGRASLRASSHRARRRGSRAAAWPESGARDSS